MIDADGAGPPSNFTMVMQWVRKLLEQKTNTFCLRFKFSAVDHTNAAISKRKIQIIITAVKPSAVGTYGKLLKDLWPIRPKQRNHCHETP